MMTRGRGGVWLSPENDDVIYEQPLTSGAIMVVLDYAYIPIQQKSLYGLNPKTSFQMLYI